MKNLGAPSKSNSHSTSSDIELENYNEIPKPSGQYDKYHTESFYHAKGIQKNYFGLSKVSHDLVLKIMRSRKANKATCLDNFPAKFLKDGAEQVVFKNILNLSLEHQYVPLDLKSGKVTPL